MILISPQPQMETRAGFAPAMAVLRTAAFLLGDRTEKIEKGAGAEAREPLTRPADGMVLRRHLRVTTVILDPFIFTGSRCCPWRARGASALQAAGFARLPINRYEILSRQESHLHSRVQSAVAYC